MSWLTPAVIAMLVGALILTFVYFYLYAKEREHFVCLWGVAWTFASIRLIFDLLIASGYDWPIWAIGSQISALLNGLFLLWGTYEMVNRKIPAWWFYGSLLCSFWIVLAEALNFPFLLLALPTYTFSALVYIWAGSIFLRIHAPAGIGRRMTGWAFILWGLHKADYPFLRLVVWFAPWGFLLSAILQLVVALGTLLVYFQKARNDLRKSEGRYRMLMEQAADGISVGDLDGNLIEVNSAMCQLLGYTRGELLSRKLTDLIVPENLAAVPLRFDEISAGKTVRMERRLRRKDGTSIPVEVNAKLLEDGRVQAIVRDITERKRTEEQMSLSDLIISTTNNLVLIANKYGEITYASPSAHRVLGYSPKEVLNEGWLNYTRRNEEERNRERNYLAAAASDQGDPILTPYERRIYDKQGKVHWILWQDTKGPNDTIIGIGADITERKQMEINLLKEKRFSDSVIDSLPGIFYLFDKQGHFLRWNENFEKVSGYSAEEVAKKGPLYFFAPEDRKLIEGKINEVFIKGSATVEANFVSKDGSSTPYFFTGRRITIDERECILGVGIDITQRRQAQETLKRSEERWRTYIEQANDLIFTLNAAGQFTSVNRAACQTFGYDPEELLGKNALEFVALEDHALIERSLDEIIKGKDIDRAEVSALTRDGRKISLEIRGRTIHQNNHPVETFHIARDITERKQTEKALRASEEKFYKAFHTSPDSIAITRFEDGVTVDVNDGFTRHTGYERTEAIGKSSLELQIWADPADRLKFVQTLQEQNEVNSLELDLRRKDGSAMIGSLSAKTIEVGGELCILTVTRDVTERKRTEDAVRQAQKLESLGILAGGVAHDFNNLLVAMLGQASLAQAKLPVESPARSHLEKTVKAAERATDLTRQLLAYSGRGQFEVQPIHLNTLIQENLHLFQVAIPKNVRLRSELAQSLPMIEGDIGQMQQVVMNLIINAAEAIGERPGTVTVTTGTEAFSAEDNQVWQHTGELLLPGCYVTLTVRDNGSGMDAKTLSSIFDPFFTTKFTGRGLGLAAVLGIVRGHHGGLQVKSREGKGTTFRLFFPALDSENEQANKVEAPPSTDRTEGLILVIDDEAPVREAVIDILDLQNLQAITAEDGATGISLYREWQDEVQLVLLDLSMPGLSGEETFTRLREINPELPILLSSGYSQKEVASRFDSQGVTGFLQKPYDVAQLLETVNRYLK